jgi:hypothetical protein
MVVSRECLTVVDHTALDKNKIFVTTDASDRCTGAVLSFGPTWETARPVAFDSCTLKGAELNYAVHEKEMLAIMRALRKWKVDLLGAEFFVYTDHKTLLNFHTQKNLSRRQSRWMEELSIYDCKFVYVKGENNTVADALSRFPHLPVSDPNVAEDLARHPFLAAPGPGDTAFLNRKPREALLDTVAALVNANPVPVGQKCRTRVSVDDDMISRIRSGYKADPWCQKLISASRGMPEVRLKDGLWFIGDRLIVPASCGVREDIFILAHDTLGHFGFFKTYESIRNSYYWPGMRSDLENGYIPGCIDCQRNKSTTSRPCGPLHPLPIPDGRCDSVAMDFIGPLPEDEGFNCILSITDRLNSDAQAIATRTDLTAEQLAVIFFDEWYCENGLPLEIITDMDKLFMAKFWKHLMILTGIKHKFSTAYHPQTDGTSERTNKTLNQMLRFHVERNQKGWKRALPRIRFQWMNTVNKSTGFSPFQLKTGRAPRVIPPMIDAPPNPSKEHVTAREIANRVHLDVAEARDNLIVAKIAQSHYANASRSDDPDYKTGDKILLSTLNRRRDYRATGENRVAKFMPRFDGPYLVVDVNSESSTVTLDLPNAPNTFPTFHTSLIKPFIPNDDTKYPKRTLEKPGPVVVDGHEEYLVDKIIDHKKIGKGVRYLVHFAGYGKEDDRWIAGRELEDNEAVDVYWQHCDTSPP